MTRNRGPLYLRDLEDQFRKDATYEIVNKRPELKKALKAGKDIVIGYYCYPEDFEVA